MNPTIILEESVTVDPSDSFRSRRHVIKGNVKQTLLVPQNGRAADLE
ncbi:hypothetical protein BOS5A_140005 [Bosea sp. EC-HK365B]|nr:hypothetical protein BOSE21B_20005 [Bosea sp. 21B]VVT56167.1 hypothetical protein BOS5A_140005 [Bosea sp. EC-HK365B]VXC29574.1 hypothetical protein BOSE127_180065 [Bosea sp. 127]